MNRIAATVVLVLVLGAVAVATVDVDSDARALLGTGSAAADALDSADGRALTLAIVDPDRERRSDLARRIATDLAADPMVARVTLEPSAPSGILLEWLWRHRLALAPPPAAAFAPAAMQAEMRRARRSLTEIAGSPLATRYLLDPTGSFRRLVETLSASRGPGLPVHRGVPQARDDSAALVFIELAERPFDVAAQDAFDRDLRARVEATGAEALLVGPRTISAAISREIASRSTLYTAIAVAALLVWIGFALRSAAGIVACILPAALGSAVAVLVLQAAFGSVHVLALGFGGALMGLAADYPLHMMAHGRDDAHVRRCVRLGAATTAIAFLSLVLAGVPALVQVGFFVAIGLVAAAGAALWMGPDLPRAPLGRGWAVPSPRLPHKLPVLVALVLVGGMGVWLLPAKDTVALAPVPPSVRASVEALDRLVGLPSGRYRVAVTGASLGDVLDSQSRLRATLARAEAAGLLARAGMLADLLPERPVPAGMPSVEAWAATLPGPLAAAGLRPGFADEIVAAYAGALSHRDVRPAEVFAIATDPAISMLVRIQDGFFVAPAMLWGVTDPAKLADMIDEAGIRGVRFVDREAEVTGGIDRLAERVRLCLGIGVVAAVGFLFAALGSRRGVVEIVLGCAAAALATAWITGIAGGGLGVFHVMALALVIGIGIDYGLLLTLSDGRQFGAALRSVLLCAATTLIAFVVMAFSGVEVLEDIGTTVALGVVAMVAVSAVQSGPARRDGAA